MEGLYEANVTEIIKKKFYFAVFDGDYPVKSSHDSYYFSIDEELVYVNFYYDFGPLNISCVYKYCAKVNTYLQYSEGAKKIIHYTSTNSAKKVNAAFLVGCFAIIYLKMEPSDIYHILLNSGGPFRPYVDASQGFAQHTINLMDCFNAIRKAARFNFVNFSDFNVNEYDLHDRLQNGDMNWLLPRKFLAFIGPTDNDNLNGHPPDFYIKYFLENDVKMVIRLNNKVYDASIFVQAGIEHHDLFFPDGTVPPKQILVKFLELTENSRAAIAVHCKAGLGRTGSLIGAYIIKHYQMTAPEAIAWMRICRPGSVIGQQHGWLQKIENWLWRQGAQYRMQHFGDGDKIPQHKYGIYSFEWPKQREKIIRQINRTRVAERENQRRPLLPPKAESFNEPFGPTPKITLSSMRPPKAEDTRKISRILNKMRTKVNEVKVAPKEKYKEQFKSDVSNWTKQIHDSRRMNFIERDIFDELTPEYEATPPPLCGRKSRLKSRDITESNEQTQGDKLNEIKAQRHAEIEGPKGKSGKLRRPVASSVEGPKMPHKKTENRKMPPGRKPLYNVHTPPI